MCLWIIIKILLHTQLNFFYYYHSRSFLLPFRFDDDGEETTPRNEIIIIFFFLSQPCPKQKQPKNTNSVSNLLQIWFSINRKFSILIFFIWAKKFFFFPHIQEKKFLFYFAHTHNHAPNTDREKNEKFKLSHHGKFFYIFWCCYFIAENKIDKKLSFLYLFIFFLEKFCL